MKALFLDRDGVINIEKNYVHNISDFEFINGVFEAIKLFINKGYIIIIITNQAGIAKGYYSDEDFKILNKWMLDRFLEQDIKIDDVYYCPYHIKGIGTYKKDSYNRKPNPGMIVKAMKKYNISVSDSVLVGDKESDILCGINAGIGTLVLVRSGHEIDTLKTKANYIEKDLYTFALKFMQSEDKL